MTERKPISNNQEENSELRSRVRKEKSRLRMEVFSDPDCLITTAFHFMLDKTDPNQPVEWCPYKRGST